MAVRLFESDKHLCGSNKSPVFGPSTFVQQLLETGLADWPNPRKSCRQSRHFDAPQAVRQTNPMLAMLTILSRFKAAHAPAAEQLRQLLLELKAQAPTEPGCLQYELFATAEDLTVFYVKDQWVDQPAVDRHVQHLKASGSYGRAVALLAEPITAVTLTEL